MAISAREHIFLNGLLYVENSKFHRSSFNKKTNVQYWAYGEKKNSNCKCFAKTVFISTISNESIDSMNDEIESDPRCDLENFREIFVSASATDEHFKYHDVDPYELLAMKFHISLNSSAKVNFLSLLIKVYQ